MVTQQTAPAVELLVKKIEPITALCFKTQATLRTLTQHSHVPKNLYQEAEQLGLSASGPVQYVYTGVNGNETNEFQLAIILPVHQAGDEPFGFRYETFPSFRCAFYTYTGPWTELGSVYDALFLKFHQEGYQNDGRVREVYTVIDLANPANCVTELQVGIVHVSD